MGGLFQLFWGRGRDLQELGCHAFFFYHWFLISDGYTWNVLAMVGVSLNLC